MKAHALGLASLLLLLTVGGCAADTGEDDEGESQAAPIIGGSETRDTPAAGIVNFSWGSYCTATLIAPRVAITASHCVRYATRDATGRYGSFTIDKQPSGSARYTVDRYRAFVGEGLGAGDVALLRLSTEVPSTVAIPAKLATSMPSNGARLTIFGYGCNDDWEHQTGGGTKRKFQYSYGTTLRETLCPGDSGGPVRVDATGAVLLINSGWVSDFWGGKRDVFGEIPQFVSRIESQKTAWSAPEPANGLVGEYFDTKELAGDAKVTRFDPAVNFDWGNGSPDPIVQSDTFSARWTGKLTAPTTGAYTIEVSSDDGVRLYVDDQLVVSDWTDHSATSHSATVSFTADQPRRIRLEYFENGGGSSAKLYWSSATTARTVIPSSRFTH